MQQSSEVKKYSPAPDVIAAILALGYWYWLNHSACPQAVSAVQVADVIRFVLEAGILFLLLRGAVKSAKLLFVSDDAVKPDTKEMGKHWLRLGMCIALLVIIGALVRGDSSEVCYDPEAMQNLLEQIQKDRGNLPQ